MLYNKMLLKIQKSLLQQQNTFLKLSVLRSFCSNNNKFGKELTRRIMEMKTKKDLQKLLKHHQGSFNVMNITALLKKVNRDILQDSDLEKRILEEVRKVWASISQNPDIQNTRGISNIIGYTANLNYHGMDEQIKKIDYTALFRYIKPKQFVMVVTGILKLEIYDKCIKQSIADILKTHVNHNFNIGQLISIWRNLIKFKKSTDELNQYFVNLILEKPINHNLKDYTYLMYCYTLTHDKITKKQGIEHKLAAYPESILYSSRINIFQICILLDNLTKFKALNPKTVLSDNFNYLLEQHYLRNIKAKVDLRMLANGYHSLINYFGVPSFQVCDLTGRKFIDILNMINQTEDFQSICSLFIQLQSTDTQLKGKKQQQYKNQIRRFTLEELVTTITKFLFDIDSKKIEKMENKEFQKLCYGYYLYKNYDNLFKFQKQEEECLIRNILSRDLSEKQLFSLINIFSSLQIKSPELSQYFYERSTKKKYEQEQWKTKKNLK